MSDYRRCSVEGCDAKHWGHGLCIKHLQRVRRHGTTELPGASFAGYAGAHDRIRSQEGPARDRECVDCGGQASEWAYDGSCAEEVADQEGVSAGRPYCPHNEHYSPRCRPCHRLYDTKHGMDNEVVRAAYLSGMSMKALAEKYGVSVMTVHSRVRDLTRGKYVTTPEQDAEIVAARERGMPIPRIADAYGISVSAVKNRLRGKIKR